MRLGFWQLHRAAYKRDLQASYAQRSRLPPLSIQQAIQLKDPRFYPLEVKGYFDTAHTILLDNKFYRHQIGYQVLTPFIADGSKEVLLVNRGWIAAGKNRAEIPIVQPLMGHKAIKGIIGLPEQPGIRLGNAKGQAVNDKTGLLRVGYFDWQALQAYIGKPLYPFMLLLAADQEGGCVRDWSPIQMKPYIHTGYAVQWFALAIGLLFAFIVTHTRHMNGKVNGET